MTPAEQRYTIGRSTIGEYEAALREINNPVSEDYRPNPDATMDCDTLLEGINYLTARIQLWTTRLNSLTYKLFSGDRTTAENISKILQTLNYKLSLYQQAHQIKCLNVQPATVAPAEPVPEVVANGNGSGFILPLLLIAGGIFVISRMKKRRGSRKKRKR